MTVKELEKKFEQLMGVVEKLSKENEDLKAGKVPVKVLPEVVVQGKLDGKGSLLLKVPVGAEFVESFPDKKGKMVDLTYLFRTGKFNKSVPLQGMPGYMVKMSIYKGKE